MIDSYPLEWEAFLQKLHVMDWERLIPGHPGAPNGRLGTKQDVQDLLALPAGRLGRGQGAGAAGQVLGAGGEGDAAAEVRELARLRERPAVRPAALLRAVGAGHLKSEGEGMQNEETPLRRGFLPRT